MKKELIICTIIVILIIVLDIITQNYTKKCVEKMTEELYSLEKELLGEAEEIEEKIKSIDNTWEKYQATLSFYIEHDELEKVETKISNINGLEKVENYNDMIPQIEESIFLLEHIRDKHILNPKNIF